jgi:hypothetical protein
MRECSLSAGGRPEAASGAEIDSRYHRMRPVRGHLWRWLCARLRVIEPPGGTIAVRLGCRRGPSTPAQG